MVEAGDHAILIGEVKEFVTTSQRGLGYVGGRYFSLGLEREAGLSGPSVCGAILEAEGGVLLEKGAKGLRPVQVEGSKPGAQRDRLKNFLRALELDARLLQVYSAFNEAGSGTHSTYFLATTDARAEVQDRIWVPIEDLPNQTYENDAIRVMMTRYARESETQNFALYLGDAEDGEIHSMS